jgi:glycosyltransferase involved in cell wall biosynthesis
MNTILFIQVGVGFLHLNRSVIIQLKKHFPDTEVELFDLMPLIRHDYKFIFINTLYVLREYLFDFITFRKSLADIKYYFLGTTYIFRKFGSLIREKVGNKKYQFILQSQCMCDASGINDTPVVIYTDHTSLNNLSYKYTPRYQYLRTDAYIQLEKKAYENAALILVMSRNIYNSLLQQYGINAEKIHEVFVSTNTPMPEMIDQTKYANQNIIFVGKDWTRKGGPLLVEAFKKVQQVLPGATLTIVGCTPDVRVKNCEVVGEVSLQEVAKRYNNASVFCLPTRREPFGIVFLEAMFNKLPIVTNNMGAAPYLVQPGRNGYLLENDIDQYAKVLTELLKDPEKCRTYGDLSFTIARDTYTWDNVGQLMYTHISKNIYGTSSVKPDKINVGYGSN